MKTNVPKAVKAVFKKYLALLRGVSTTTPVLVFKDEGFHSLSSFSLGEVNAVAFGTVRVQVTLNMK